MVVSEKLWIPYYLCLCLTIYVPINILFLYWLFEVFILLYSHITTSSYLSSLCRWFNHSFRNYPDTGADIEDGDDIIVPRNSRRWKMAMDKVYAPIYNNLLQSSDYIERIREIFDWDWEYIAPCHGEPIEGTECKQVLARHLGFEWTEAGKLI